MQKELKDWSTAEWHEVCRVCQYTVLTFESTIHRICKGKGGKEIVIQFAVEFVTKFGVLQDPDSAAWGLAVYEVGKQYFSELEGEESTPPEGKPTGRNSLS